LDIDDDLLVKTRAATIVVQKRLALEVVIVGLALVGARASPPRIHAGCARPMANGE